MADKKNNLPTVAEHLELRAHYRRLLQHAAECRNCIITVGNTIMDGSDMNMCDTGDSLFQEAFRLYERTFRK